jgi:hypothetical protein
MNKQTALKWFVEQLGLDATTDYKEEIDQAIQMEREQIYQAWNDGCSEGIEGGQSTNCEEFYNNTYGGKYE